MQNNFDIIVIGSGIAGLNFALQASHFGQVAIITKTNLSSGNSLLAQGGVAAVMMPPDNFKKHIDDTMRAGCFLNNKKAVKIMIENAPQEINRLISWGVNFDKEDNKLDLAKEGAHSEKRIVHTKDTTGRSIENTLVKLVKINKNIKIFTHRTAISLLVKNKECFGVKVWNSKNKKIENFIAKATVLSTGGLAQIYNRNCNSPGAIGDGIVMANQAGAKTKDLEFIQFHPTALSLKNRPTFLLSEALRGAGAIIKNHKNKAIMEKLHAQKDLAPRDIVSRALYQSLKNGAVFLDMRHKNKKFLLKHFPYIYNRLKKYGLKMEKELIPIAPAAHYTCGGIETNTFGQTNIKNLLAIGEVACTGVHGANRLASNSLLECLVFSSRAAKIIKKVLLKNKKKQKIKFAPIKYRLFPTPDFLIKKIKYIMWEKVGIIRKKTDLQNALEELQQIREKIAIFTKNGWNEKLNKLENICDAAILVTTAAKKRKKSVGAHYLTTIQ